MKKTFLVLGLVLIVGIGSAFVYADGGSEDILRNESQDKNGSYDSMEKWHNNMMDRRKEDLEKAVKEGKISEEDSKVWEEHYDYMDEFHKENGHMGMRRGCHSRKGSGMKGMHKRNY